MNHLSNLEMFLNCCLIVDTNNYANYNNCDNKTNLFVQASFEIDNCALVFGKEVASFLYHHHL